MDQDKAAAPGGGTEPTDEQIQALLEEPSLGERGTGTDLMGILQRVQDRFGYLPPRALERISRRVRIPLSRIYGVVSFYSQFYTSPRGRHTIRACRGTACHVRGARRIVDAIQGHLGIEEGQTTPDMLFYLETVACLGTCFLAPVMMIDDQYFGKLTPQRVESILKSFEAKET